jgi:hypothetical protein
MSKHAGPQAYVGRQKGEARQTDCDALVRLRKGYKVATERQLEEDLGDREEIWQYKL